MKLPKNKQEEALKHFLRAYKYQWDLNRYMRDEYDDSLEYYMGYRPKERYPMAYNESFNKLLPKTTTILSRFMDQLYQAGTGDLISVKPRKRADVERAPRVKGLLNYQLENLNCIDMQGGSYWINYQWMFNAVNWGTGIVKLYWRKEDRIAPLRRQVPVPAFDNYGRLVGMETVDVLTEAEQTIYDAPYAEVLHNKLCVPHPHYKNIQTMPNFFVVYKRSMEYLRQKAEQGVFRNLKDLGWSSSKTDNTGTPGDDTFEAFAKSIEIDSAYTMEQILSDRSTPMVDIIEGYGKYIFPEDETAYEVGSGVKIKGKESEAIVHIGNYKCLLSIQKNEYGIRPFFDIHAYHHPELFWGIGVIKLGKGLQEQYNNLANLRMQNVSMGINQMLKVHADWDGDPSSLIWKPFGLVPVENMDEIQPLEVPDLFQSNAFREQENFFNECLDEMTGMYRYNQGATPERQEHVGTIYSIQSMGEARTKLLLMTMDHTGFRPFLKYMMLLNLFHLPNNFEARINGPQGDQFVPMFAGDIHVDYDFSARYTSMEPALAKQFRVQNLLQLNQVWAQSPELNQYQWKKAIMELMDFPDTEKYLYSPEQMQASQQQQMQQMVQAQLMQAQLEDQMTGREQQRKMIADLSKEQLKIEGDLAKEQVKGFVDMSTAAMQGERNDKKESSGDSR